jgi:hypothetical protein
MRAILCRVGWMSRYNGREDPPCPSESNLDGKQNGNGEGWNFAPCEDGRVRGYVALRGADNFTENSAGTINLDKLGGRRGSPFIDGVKVIFFASHPTTKENVVVGWYENARVYRQERQLERGYGWGNYRFEAKAEDAFLIPENHRNIRLENNHKGSRKTGKESLPRLNNLFYASPNPARVHRLVKKLEALPGVVNFGLNDIFDD